MSDFRQQQEAEEERMAHNLHALERIEKAGMPEIASDLARELGLYQQFQRFTHKEAA